MNSYMNAPATKMIATNCCVCARPLCDAKSVELGIGPDCRRKYGYENACTEEVRKQANALVHQIALVQKGEPALLACKELHDLGFVDLSDRILTRLTKIVLAPLEIAMSGGALSETTFTVSTPFSKTFCDLLKAAKVGAVWNPVKKRWAVPNTAKRTVLGILEATFPGAWAKGPRGPFVLKASVDA